jgi:manganese transport protein
MSQKRAGVLEVLKQMGPGYMQSAMTLGGGTAFAAIFGGAAFGYRLLWVAPVSMALGVVVLSAVAHQTLCTGEDPFRAMKRHAGPFFAYGWGIAAILSSIIWQFAQYALAASMLVLLADQLGWSGAPRWAAGLIALVWCVAVGLLYDRSARLVRVYENVLKGMVWLIIVCFLVVVIRTGVPDPGALLAGFVPSVPEDVVTPDGGRISAVVVIVSGLAAAVGVNMLFVYPYTLRKRGWGRDDRRMAGLDLVFGMLVPYAIAASLILIASASTFHFAEPELFTGKRIAPDQVARVLASPDRLGPVLGVWVFGLGIVAMALSSITMQMLCSGFACETVFGWERGMRRYTLGTLLPAIGVLGAVFWGDIAMWVALPTNVVCGLLLPVAYVGFIILQRRRAYLGGDTPRGARGALWLAGMILATGVLVAGLVTVIVTQGPGFVGQLRSLLGGG